MVVVKAPTQVDQVVATAPSRGTQDTSLRVAAEQVSALVPQSAVAALLVVLAQRSRLLVAPGRILLKLARSQVVLVVEVAPGLMVREKLVA